MTEHTLKAGGVTGGPDDPPLHEAGEPRDGARPDGRVVLVCGDERYELREGDAVTFDADLPHHFENPGRKEATFLAVVTSGLRRA